MIRSCNFIHAACSRVSLQYYFETIERHAQRIEQRTFHIEIKIIEFNKKNMPVLLLKIFNSRSTSQVSEI